MRRDNGYTYQNLKKMAVSKSMERLVSETRLWAQNLKKKKKTVLYF